MKRKVKLLAISLTLAVMAALGIGAGVYAATPDAPAAATCPCGGNGGNGNGGGWLGVSTQDVVAKLLGMTPEQLAAERQKGQSLVQIAATKKVTQQQLVDAIMAAKKAALDARVKAGTLTQERATFMLQQMEKATTEAVTRTTVGPPAGRGNGGAGQGWGQGRGGRMGATR